MSRLVTRADAEMAKFCGFPRNSAGVHTFEASAYELYPLPDPARLRALAHDMPRVASITSIYVDADWEYGSETLIDHATDCVIDNDQRVIWLKPTATDTWGTTERSNKLTVVCGWTTTPDAEGRSSAPDDLVELCAMAVRTMWDRLQSEGIVSSTVAGHSVTRSQDDAGHVLPRAVRVGLADYVRWGSRVG